LPPLAADFAGFAKTDDTEAATGAFATDFFGFRISRFDRT
jgi:hypothetical protein